MEFIVWGGGGGEGGMEQGVLRFNNMVHIFYLYDFFWFGGKNDGTLSSYYLS